jgi:hypothetical protein
MPDEGLTGWVKWSPRDKTGPLTDMQEMTLSAGLKGQDDVGPSSPPLQLNGKENLPSQERGDSNAQSPTDGAPAGAEGEKIGPSRGGEADSKKKQEWVVWEKRKYDEFLASYAAASERVKELEEVLSSPQDLGEEECLREDEGVTGCDGEAVGEGESDCD